MLTVGAKQISTSECPRIDLTEFDLIKAATDQYVHWIFDPFSLHILSFSSIALCHLKLLIMVIFNLLFQFLLKILAGGNDSRAPEETSKASKTVFKRDMKKQEKVLSRP